MHIYASDGQWDDARIDYDDLVKAFKTQPEVYSFQMPDVNYAPSDGKSIVSVVGLAGLSPIKQSFDLRIRTDKDLHLVQVLYTDTDGREAEYGHIPLDIGEDFYFKFSIPRVERRPSTISRIQEQICAKLSGIFPDLRR